MFVEPFTNYLNANRQLTALSSEAFGGGWTIFFNKTAWYGKRGKTGKIYRDGINVFQIHGNRVFCFFSQFKSHIRRCRTNYYINFFKRFLEIFSYQAPYFLGFNIISVVITGGKRVSA